MDADLHNPSCGGTRSRPRHRSHSRHLVASSAAALFPSKNQNKTVTSHTEEDGNLHYSATSGPAGPPNSHGGLFTTWFQCGCCRSAPGYVKQAQTDGVGEQRPIRAATQPPSLQRAVTLALLTRTHTGGHARRQAFACARASFQVKLFKAVISG